MTPAHELDELRRLYREGLESRIAGLVAARAGIALGDRDAETSIRRVAHALRGSGGAYGYPEISAAAAALEDSSEAELVSRLEDLIATLGAVVASRAPAPKQRVLLVEDDAETQRLLRFRIASPTRELAVARTGAEAERLLETEDFALVVLDLSLPDADGRNLLARLRERPRTAALPVIVLTARCTKQIQAECYALGADQFFSKPCDADILAASVAATLQRAASATREARRDGLTGLPNRAALREGYERAAALAARSGEPVSLAILDLDKFKVVNDTHGHATGDEVLRRAASVIARTLRQSDLVARWGGDEFVVLLPRTDATGAARALDKARAALARETFTGLDGRPFTIALSYGVAAVPRGAALEEVLADADASLYGAKAVRAAPAPLAPPARKVLVAEDDESVAAILRQRLRGAGFEVVHRRDGAAALEASRDGGYCLAILDVRMPELDGLTVLSRLRADPGFGHVPIALLTSLGKERDIVRGFELGADDYIVKPFAPNELIARIRRLADRRTASVAALSRVGGMAGSFIGDQLVELVQMLGLNTKTGVLSVVSDSLRGKLAFRDGLVVGAESSRGHPGAPAARDVLGARHGTFEFSPELAPVSRLETALHVEPLLLEALRLRDEARRGEERR